MKMTKIQVQSRGEFLPCDTTDVRSAVPANLITKMNKLILVFSALLCLSGPLAAQVLVETESFASRGGWVADHQAFPKIQSAYLMAHGLGRPVADATTSVEFPAKAKYHVYVSTYNWTSPWYAAEGPGAFKVVVNGKALPNTLGTKGKRWEWQYAGEVTVGGKVKIALRDLTGFNGRADAIYFSPEKTPPPADYAEARAWRDKLQGHGAPTRAPKVDLVVVGGGVAGCATALTAARYGLKVAIVDNLPWLGGSNALGVKACGLMYENLYPELGNITCQLLGMDIARKNDPKSHQVRPNNTGFMWALASFPAAGGKDRESTLLDGLERLSGAERDARTKSELNQNDNEYRRRDISALREKFLKEAGVAIYQNIHVYAVDAPDGRVHSVTGRSLRTGEPVTFEGTLFADCTGDGVVGFLAGAECMVGRESKSYANEPTAPAEADRKMMGSSMHWYAYPRENPGKFPTPAELPWAMQCSSNYFIDKSQWEWWWETGLEIDNAEEAELVRDNFLRAVFGNWAYLRNNMAKYSEYRLDYLQHIAMKRESRRIKGDVVLNQNDLSKRVAYPDASFTTTWTMDLHYAKPDNARNFPGWEWITYCTNEPEIWIKPYHVPYRCLYSKDIPNLFIGGRNMSVTHQALGTVRVQATLGMAGEVTGMAAKICKEKGATPREVYTQYLDELIACMKAGAPLK